MKNALIITDNVQIRDDFKRIIQGESTEFTVVTASNLEEAQTLLKSRQGPALIFVDPLSQAFKVADVLRYKRSGDVVFTLPVMVSEDITQPGKHQVLAVKTYWESASGWATENLKAA